MENKKVLVVDDNPENLHILINILKDSFTVVAATNGKKALELAKLSSKPDMILLDIIMPDIDGYEVCKELKNDISTADIPVIFVSAKTQDEDKKIGMQIGAIDYIAKPIVPQEVISSIKKHI